MFIRDGTMAQALSIWEEACDQQWEVFRDDDPGLK